MKKFIILLLVLTFSLSCLYGCTVYKHNPLPEKYDADMIIGRTPEEIIEQYGEPYFTTYYDESNSNISAIAYETGYINEGLDGYSEFLYIQFDKDTGLANSMIHPWADGDRWH